MAGVDEFPHFDLGLLTERQRDVIHLRYSCCLSWRGIGTILDVTPMAAFQCHERAIARLREAQGVYTSSSKVEA
jgi:DNA-directed RNA polymerase specialized sigma subunit